MINLDPSIDDIDVGAVSSVFVINVRVVQCKGIRCRRQRFLLTDPLQAPRRVGPD